jgi:hypothetical protein
MTVTCLSEISSTAVQVFSRRVHMAALTSCSYCCGDILVGDREEVACGFCGHGPSRYGQGRDTASSWTPRLIQRSESREGQRGYKALIKVA